MKNIETILNECGITATPEQLESVSKMVGENYKTIAEVEKKDAKIETLTAKVKETEEMLKTFDGIDAEGMKKQIADLTQSLQDKDAEYNAKMADRDFQDCLNASIAKANGLNAKAIKALLDIDALKSSQNQNEDIDKAVKALAEAEDSKMLFGDSNGNPLPNPIGSFNRNTTQPNYFKEKYGNNPHAKF